MSDEATTPSELQKLIDKYPSLASAAGECFVITEAILHKLLIQHDTGKDKGLKNMLAACLKHSGAEATPEAEVNEEDAKTALEKEARSFNIELDRRETLAHMQQDYDNQMAQITAARGEDIEIAVDDNVADEDRY